MFLSPGGHERTPTEDEEVILDVQGEHLFSINEGAALDKGQDEKEPKKPREANKKKEARAGTPSASTTPGKK